MGKILACNVEKEGGVKMVEEVRSKGKTINDSKMGFDSVIEKLEGPRNIKIKRSLAQLTFQDLHHDATGE